MPGATPSPLIAVESVTTAVALLTRYQLAPEVPREDVLGDVPAADVLQALESITAGVLEGVQPADHGARLLEHIGTGIARLGGA